METITRIAHQMLTDGNRALARGARVLCYGHLLSSLIEPAKVGATLGTGQRGVATDVARVVFTVGAAVTRALHWVLAGHPGALHCPTVHLTKEALADLTLVDPTLSVGILDGCLLVLAKARPVTLWAAVEVNSRVRAAAARSPAVHHPVPACTSRAGMWSDRPHLSVGALHAQVVTV